MDYRQNIQIPGRPEQSNGTPQPQPARPRPFNSSSNKRFDFDGPKNWLTILSVVNLIGIALLLLAVSLTLMAGKNTYKEADFVDVKKYQAVFMNNGQVYFGKIRALNSQFVSLYDVYYLTQTAVKNADGTTGAGDFSLEKLGCRQIHYPNDHMMINRGQVTFWENLNSEGKIVKSIEQFVKDNPNGPNCSEVSNQTQSAEQPQQAASDKKN